MPVATKRPGERFQVADLVEVQVLYWNRDHVKLGIRSLRQRPNTPPPVARVWPGGCPGYYHSDCGVTTLVVRSTNGQRIEIDEAIELSLEILADSRVQFTASGGNRRRRRF